MTKEKKNLNYKQLLSRMYDYVRPYKIRFFSAFAATILVAACEAAVAWVLRPYMDVVLIEKAIKSTWHIPVAIMIFAFVQASVVFLAIYLSGWVGTRLIADVKEKLYKKLLKYETAFYDKNTSGFVVARFSTDVDIAFNGFIDNGRFLLNMSCMAFFLAGILFYNSWKLAIIALGVLSLTVYPLVHIRKRIKMISEALVKENGKLLTSFNETFAGNKVITSYNLKPFMQNRFISKLSEVFKFSMKMIQVNAMLSPFMHVVATFGVAMVLWYGTHLIQTEVLSTGAFVSFIVALLLIYRPIKTLGRSMTMVHNSLVAVARVFDLMDYEPEIKTSNKDNILQGVETGITFENVWFEYEKDTPVLRGINLNVKKGETIALVGNSGGGKSTIANLLPRFYDVKEGSIKIDNNDLRDLKLSSLRENIAFVFQDNFLFNASIKENIALGEEYSQEALDKAIEGAFLTDFIDTLEEGIDTFVGERGSRLSGGQKQRVAIARAILKDAPIVILDEATSALDNQAELIVQKAMDSLMKNRTVFVIAHRLSTIKNADRIAVINDGQIVELGSHDELIKIENGQYKALYSSQFESAEAGV